MPRKPAKKQSAELQEYAFTLFLNGVEVGILWSLGEQPDFLAAGALLSRGLIAPGEKILSIETFADIATVLVKTSQPDADRARVQAKSGASACTVEQELDQLHAEAGKADLPKLDFMNFDPIRIGLALQTLAITRRPLVPGYAAFILRDQPEIAIGEVTLLAAVETLAGYLRLEAKPAGDRMLFLDGSPTGEIVAAAIRMRVQLIMAIGEPTTLAKKLAKTAGISLLAGAMELEKSAAAKPRLRPARARH